MIVYREDLVGVYGYFILTNKYWKIKCYFESYNFNRIF